MIIAVPFVGLAPVILGSDGIVVAINVEMGLRRIIQSLSAAPAIAVVIADHGGGCARCQSDKADNSQSSGFLFS
jgi:hypothetical protein